MHFGRRYYKHQGGKMNVPKEERTKMEDEKKIKEKYIKQQQTINGRNDGDGGKREGGGESLRQERRRKNALAQLAQSLILDYNF